MWHGWIDKEFSWWCVRSWDGIRIVHRSMGIGSRVADALYIKRVLLALDDFLFFSLYSFSCIAKQVTTLKQLRLFSCLDFLETHLKLLALFSDITLLLPVSPTSDPVHYTYINTSIIPLRTILLSLLSFTLFRTFQGLCIIISSCAHLALIQLAEITFVGLIMCSAISFYVALLILTKNIFQWCPSFNLKAFERQQLYEIWPFTGSIIICLCVYNPIYSSSNLSYSKVHLNIDVIMYGSFGPPFLSMKSISSAQCLASVYEAWSCLGARTIFLPFDTQRITTMNIEFSKSGRLLLAMLLGRSPKSVAGRVLPRLPFFLASWISLAHIFKNISSHCRQIHSALLKLSNSSQVLNVSKQSATPASLCRGPSQTCFNRFCPRMLARCFFSWNPAIHAFFHLLNTL